ncbi:hypothetical protein F5Y17DRAFT_291432 [Xylariaceae sp. FL0594]|nr:hypothetical protein F5Y17DRAFT_291432 [Xylariaceae sp. FL0594]
MSADLFAAFGDLSTSQQQSQSKHSPPISAPTTTRPTSKPAFGSPAPNHSQNQWAQPSQSPLPQYQRSWQDNQPSRAFPSNSYFVTATTDNSDDDDGWGDFELAPNNGTKGAGAEPQMMARDPGVQRTRIVRASTLDLVSNSLVDFQDVSPELPRSTMSHLPGGDLPPGSVTPGAGAKKEKKIDPNVLFDADDFEEEQVPVGLDDDDTDFGEFETVSPPSQPPPSTLSTSSPNKVERASDLLLELELNEPPSASSTRTPQILPVEPIQRHPTAQSTDSNRQRPTRTEEPRINEARPKRQILDEDWDLSNMLQGKAVPATTESADSSWDWEPVEEPASIQSPTSTKGSAKAPGNSNATNNSEDASWDWGELEITTGETAAEIETVGLPPTNIPPPSILMSIFPQLFSQANERLYKPISGQPPTVKDRVLSDPRVYEFLRGYLALATVAARIVVGRKMRWHRDKYLAQTMSISAAGSKGMKLAGVDKLQATREAREAVDVVTAWKSQAGRLRSTVASVNSTTRSIGKSLRVPEITDTIQVQTAKGVPTATKACVICGLKRNERLSKIDHDVEDSFGEWWVDHWGHVACKRFWLQHEKTLRQR